MSVTRREFLKSSTRHSSALVASSLLPAALPALSFAASNNDAAEIRVLMREADGSPLEKDRAMTLCARDVTNDPLPQKITQASGRARIELPQEPIQVSL